MLNRNSPYYRQVELVMRVLPLVAQEPRFALKGGTAINLFIRDLPRLSVDIDLTYLPPDNRDAALSAIEDGLNGIGADVERVLADSSVNAIRGEDNYIQRLQITAGGISIKIEVSPVLRGSVLDASEVPVMDSVADQFGYVETHVLSLEELYAGKLVAALDRQHPRDLFDVMILLESDGITSELMDLFVIYLISSNRPIAELLAPRLQPLQEVFEQQFQGMSIQPVTVSQLEDTRNTMIESLRYRLTDNHKRFLLSLKSGEPKWDLLKHAHAQDLPAVLWKLENIQRLTSKQRVKALSKLRKTLDDMPG
ncbi:MAG: nucleotidyl transferase AbiEii/AbiGii toxin family protein [Candidatus Thiodiazotropha sp. (ex. Lucinisca nassula)]|nr:nucleotidyl transferase AbiEii/AbiGii toxin family protein [Candidatus Thiodiazotropha sp. (ex. Lucinisca nassula)]MBW9271204.1 nucleotidyl transferase AbiEii/AbiGii toxin family protein [Candidatus Thiodiazotropha sp. (ex. Lucinisca nassula)]